MLTKKSLIATAFLICLADTSFAADLDDRMAQPVYARSFGGGYVGAVGGYGFGHKSWTLIDNAGPGACNQCGTEVTNFAIDGFLGGVELGYNYEVGTMLLGVEADIMFAHAEGSGTWIAQGNEIRNGASDIDWLATVGPRLGAVSGNTLVYIEGGLAYANESHSHLGDNNNVFTGDETRHGWYAGGGVEFLLGNNWTLKTEYNYVDLGSERVSLTRDAPINNTAIFDIKQDFQVIKVGLNYHF